MDDSGQFTMLAVGILLGQDDSTLDMDAIANLEDLRIFLNSKYNIDIAAGMTWPNVLAEVKNGIDTKRFNDAMGIV